MITASLVKELREITSAGMLDCKKALEETNGDIKAAIEHLRKKGIAKAAKKADRDASEGIIAARISEDGKTGFLLEINCETDFVSRNENFISFVDEVADALAASDAENLEQALQVQLGDQSIEDTIKAKVLEIGENLKLRKFKRIKVENHGGIGNYIHMGGKIGVLVAVSTDAEETAAKEAFQALAKDLTLQVTASNPKGISREDIDEEVLAKEKEIYAAQLIEEGKPAELIDKILPGKLKRFYAENCLLEQKFSKDPEITVSELLDRVSKEVGDELKVTEFVRFALGE